MRKGGPSVHVSGRPGAPQAPPTPLMDLPTISLPRRKRPNKKRKSKKQRMALQRRLAREAGAPPPPQNPSVPDSLADGGPSVTPPTVDLTEDDDTDQIDWEATASSQGSKFDRFKDVSSDSEAD